MADENVIAPTLESMTVKEEPKGLCFTDFESRSGHPFNPWGPITKFYVRFTVRPVRQLFYQLHGGSESRAYHHEPYRTGVVLARAYEGGANLCIWSGQITDKLLHVGGIDAEIAKSVSKSLHDWLIDMPRMKELVGVEVDMRVVTPVVVPDGNDVVSHGIYG